MNIFDCSNLTDLMKTPGQLNVENFYLQGTKNQFNGITWSLVFTKYPKYKVLYSTIFSQTVIQGEEFRNLAINAANESRTASFGGLEKDKHFIYFCRKLKGIETVEHKKQRIRKILNNSLEKAKIIGKGLAKNTNLKKLEEFAWLEALSPDHRYGFDLEREWLKWQNDPTSLSFNEWRKNKQLVGISPNQVKYLNADERKQYEVTFVEGMAMREGIPFNSSSEVSIFSGKGIAIYALSADGKLYVGSHDKGKFHHSSFLAGAPVIGAGEIQMDEEGQIIFLSPNSGHYNPSKKELLAVLQWLQEKGVNLKNVKLCVPEDGENLYYHNAEQFLLVQGNILPDGIDQAIFERKEGKISSIQQCNLKVGRSQNRELLQALKDKEDLDLSTVMFKESTSWGDIFSYHANEYCEKGQIIPEWDGGECVIRDKELSEICILKQRSLNEYEALEKNILVLQYFNLKGFQLEKVLFTPEPPGPSYNAQTYFDDNYPNYMQKREENLREEL